MSEPFLRFKCRPEFRSRLYYWSLEDAEREVLQCFPLVSQVRSKTALTFLSVMKSMTLEEQLVYARLLVRYLWKDDLQGGDIFSNEELSLRKHFFHQMHTSERKLYEQGVLSVSKQKIDYKTFGKLLETELAKNLGSIYMKDGIYRFAYRRTIDMWNINTSIFLGGKGKVDYTHIISRDIESNMRLEPLIAMDIMRWLGIGQTDWGLMCNQDILATVKSITTICSHFVEQAPKLLTNLSPDTVTVEP